MNTAPEKLPSGRSEPAATPPVRIGQTHLGNAVFSAQSFAAGDEIGWIDGHVIDDADYGSSYGMDLGGTLTLEPGPPFRFLNHSCEPNCELVMHDEPSGPPTMWLYAVTDIAASDELTIDYSWPADAAIECGCGKPSCRGWVVDPAELDQVLAREAAGNEPWDEDYDDEAEGDQASASNSRLATDNQAKADEQDDALQEVDR